MEKATALARLIDITAKNVTDTGFFCKMSARGKPGYERKLVWLQNRFAEGLEMKMLGGGERGFIEWIPGAYAWRAIENADAYLVVHCLWVVGKSKGKGFGTQLLQQVVAAAQSGGYKGVTLVASSKNWLLDGRFLLRQGFTLSARFGPFQLLTLKFEENAPTPRFCGSFDARLLAAGKGVTVFKTDQCPYLDDAVRHCEAAAENLSLPIQTIHLDSVAKVRQFSPTPYGVFAVTLDSKLISHHYLLKKHIQQRLVSRG